MKIVSFAAFGVPSEVAACIEAPEVGAPGDDEIIIEIDAFPINPVDLLTIQGLYASRPALPATPGSEGAGQVVAVGKSVDGLQPGDRVVNLGRDNWAQRLKIKAVQAIKVPSDGDVLQQAMLKVNPATALLMLRNFVQLGPGDWVIQDAANSGVGTSLIRLAKAAGVRTVNVVRREALIAPLQAIGADVVVVDGEDLAARVTKATGGAPIKLAIDAVAGETCQRLAQCLTEGGTVVNYGLLSGHPCMIAAADVIFRNITLTGFWLSKHLGEAPRRDIEALYQDLSQRLSDGDLHVPVEAVYGIDDIQTALAHAAQSGRDGKILVTPNRKPG